MIAFLVVSYIGFGLSVAVLYPVLTKEDYADADTPPALLVALVWPLMVGFGLLYIIGVASDRLGKGIMKMIEDTE